jgi:hypothetical protein
MMAQIPSVRKRFPTYHDYAAFLRGVIYGGRTKGALVREAGNGELLRRKRGNFTFTVQASAN